MEDIKVYTKEVNGQTVNYQEITTETVIANPNAAASEQLEKLQVGEKVYSVEGGGNYVLELTGESGALTDEQYQAVVNNFPNVSILYQGTLIDIIKTSITTSGTFLFAFTILSGNIISTTSWSIASDKSWNATLEEVTIPTSSGGLTKTKVTLADLQALMTEENIGTIVGIASKIDVSFATLGLPEVFIITQNLDFGIGIYGDGSLVGAGTENNFVITSVSFSIRATNKKMELRAMNLGGSPLAIDLGTPQDMSEMLLIDDNFDFYIYK